MLDHRPGVHHVCKGGKGSCIVNLNRSEYKPHQRETKASTNIRRPNGSIPNSFTLSEQQVPERRPEGSRREHSQTTQQTTAGWQCTHTPGYPQSTRHPWGTTTKRCGFGWVLQLGLCSTQAAQLPGADFQPGSTPLRCRRPDKKRTHEQCSVQGEPCTDQINGNS